MSESIVCIKTVFFVFILIIFIFVFSTFSYCNYEKYSWAQTDSKDIPTSNTLDVSDFSNIFSLESASAILIEQNSGKVLYEYNSHEQLRPASVTKVMTILLIMEALDNGRISLEDKVPCSENAASMGGSQIWLDVREELTVHEMLKAICVVSANDACVAMAEYLEGSTESFVNKMNIKAKELGMNDTVFKNCHGIDEEGHVTSAYDIALMSRELLIKHPDITKYTTIYMDTLRDGKSELVNTNKLIRNYKGATGLKTGSTSIALYNLSASATRDNLSLIAVIMKAPTTQIRFNEAQKLLDYGFNNYSYIQFANKGDVFKSINVGKGIDSTVDVIYENNAGALIKKGDSSNIEQILTIDENIVAPISENQQLGKITYILNNEAVGEVKLVSQSNIEKLNIASEVSKVIFIWFNILR